MESIKSLREYGHDCCARIDDAIKELADNIEDEVAERYVALPLDADGVPIRVGDDMETLMVGHEGNHSPVEWVSLTADGWNVDGEPPTSMRHYQPPTVESTLREFADVVRKERVELAPISEETIAEYAAKLCLADGKEQ